MQCDLLAHLSVSYACVFMPPHVAVAPECRPMDKSPSIRSGLFCFPEFLLFLDSILTACRKKNPQHRTRLLAAPLVSAKDADVFRLAAVFFNAHPLGATLCDDRAQVSFNRSSYCHLRH